MLVKRVWSLGGLEVQVRAASALCDVPPGAFRQLQFRPRLVRQLRADHHRRETHAGRKWTVPVGAVAGRIIKLGGKLPVKLSFGGYYNVVTRQYGAKWQLQSLVAAREAQV